MRPDRARLLLRLICLLALLIGLNLAARQLLPDHPVAAFDALAGEDEGRGLVSRSALAAAALYVLVLAVPFVPGVEIGLALIAMFGPPVVPLVYGCTVAGLALSYAVGRLVPEPTLRRAAHALHLRRTEADLAARHGRSADTALAELTRTAPGRLVPWLLRHRCLALALAINLPGNSLIGGGGGIALLAGMSRLFSVPVFLMTVALAVLPVPLVVIAFDIHMAGP